MAFSTLVGVNRPRSQLEPVLGPSKLYTEIPTVAQRYGAVDEGHRGSINAAEIDEPHEDVILGLNDELTDKG